MSGYIKLTDHGSGKKKWINMDQYELVRESDGDGTSIEKESNSGDNWHYVKETPEEIMALIDSKRINIGE